MSWSENGETAELYSADRPDNYSSILLTDRTNRTTEIRFRVVPRPESWLQVSIEEYGGDKRRSLKSFSMPETIGRAFIALITYRADINENNKEVTNGQ